MRFSAKLFLCTMLILTAALALAEYYTVSTSLTNAVGHQVESGLQQHQLVKYAIQSGILAASRSDSVDEATLGDIALQTAEAMSVELSLSRSDGTALYSNTAWAWEGEAQDEGVIRYQIQPGTSGDGKGGGEWLVVDSVFDQNGYTLELTTVQDVSGVFSEADQLRQRCQTVFLAATLAGSLLMLLLSWLLTRPIQRLERASQAFARGDFTRRIPSRSRDEIGDLTRTYNWMADTIEGKIEELELAVRQREEFVANFAHELKTPMTSIIGYADTIYQKKLTAAQIHEAAGYILNEGMRLEALSFKLLELITLERQDFLLEEMELRDLLRDVEETAFPAALKRRVKLSVSGQPGYARVEYDLFKTLLLNLLDNAFKSGGGRVQLTGRVEGERYLIRISDDGRGIPADQLRRITEAFYMVDKSRSRKEHGAGLGLALCARIAAIHGTKLEYDTAEGCGTTVQIALKLCPPEEEETPCE